MAGRRRKHKPTFKPKDKPRVKAPSPPAQSSEPAYSEPPLIVFISSLIDKMKKERSAVKQGVRSILITRPWAFEDTSASSQPLEESYLSKVRTCDIFVLVLGREYSEPVAREYETALEAGKPILTFVYDGARDAEQDSLVRAINNKHAHYNGPADLQRAVAGAIWDELIRAHRSYIRPNTASQVIQQITLPTPNIEDFIGYFIIGSENAAFLSLLKMFGATDVSVDLAQRYPHLEPLPIVNIFEVNKAISAIQTANQRSQTAPNRSRAFAHELRKEALELASHYVKGQRIKTPQPEVTMPYIDYYIWGMEHNFARLVKLMRLEEFLKEPITIERTRPELLFKDADHFVRVSTIIADASEKAAGDLDELHRLLVLEATLFSLKGTDQEDDSTHS